MSCRTDTRWAPFKLSYESLNSYYGGKDHDSRLDASHCDDNAISKSETRTNVAKNLDDQALTPRHVKGHGGLKVFNNI